MNEEPLYINDPNALVTAAYEGEYELVKTLIAKGADPNVTNEHGDTAVMLASEHGFDTIVELLLDHGANVNAKDNDGDTALDIARYHGCKSTTELVLARGAKGEDGPSAKERMMDAFYEDCEKANVVKLSKKLPDAKKP